MIRYSSPPRPFFPLMPLATQLCVGEGIELGASAHNRFDLIGSRNASPYEGIFRKEFEFHAKIQDELCGAHALADIHVENHQLPLPDHSLDYVISSHVVEHLPDVISAFVEWDRVLKYGGIVFMIVPLRDALPEDRDRPLTTLDDIWDDYKIKHTVATHPIEGVPGGQGGHYHVFTLDLMVELIQSLVAESLINWKIEVTEAKDSKVGNGFTVIARTCPPIEKRRRK